MKEVKLSALIPPAYHIVHRELRRQKYIEYWLKGGRGSGKSSFVSLAIILGMMRDASANAAIVRKVYRTLRESVYEQLLWAIEMLNVSSLWRGTVSPLSLRYLPTGQRIVFRGLDGEKKIKSAKLKRGYFKYVWFEELSEFSSYDEVRAAMQTFVRGGEGFSVFMSYNPPRSVKSWVNSEIAMSKPSRMVHHSTYLDMLAHPDGAAWLGEAFVTEAQHLERTRPERYAHEYLGEVTGTGGEVFTNVELRAVTDAEIAAFDRVRFGIDWGYAADPFAFVAVHYDAARRRIFIFDEIFCVGLSNRDAAERILVSHPRTRVTCDCSEPKSIDELISLGVRAAGAKKGAGSVSFGIKWLSSLEEIVIDPARCPNAAREFSSFELAPDAFGGFVSRFPDTDNHTVDAVRYALEREMRSRSTRFLNLR